MSLRLAFLVGSASAALLGCPAGVVSTPSHGSTGDGPGSGGAGGSVGSTLPEVQVACEDRIDYCLGSDCQSRRDAIYGHDVGGRLVSYRETGAAGDVLFALTRQYDGAGRRVRQDEEDHEYGPLHRSVTWDYDDGNHVTSTTALGFAFEGSTLETRFFYDDQGRPARFETLTNGALTEVTRLVRIESASQGEPLVIELVRDTGLDGKTERMVRWTLAEGRWLTRLEQLQGEVVVAREDYTYADQTKGQVSGRDLDLDADGAPDEKDEILRDASGQVQHCVFDSKGAGAVDESDDYLYDAEGRLTERRLKIGSVMGSTPIDATTTIGWSEGGIDHVERRDTVTHELWESWSFVRGCSGDLPKDVKIAPLYSWTRELETVPFDVDASTWWGFPEAL
jgi:hypothetical protein